MLPDLLTGTASDWGRAPAPCARSGGRISAGRSDDFLLRRDQIQHLADILAHHAQIAAAIGAAAARIEFLAPARRAVRDPGTAAGWAIGDLAGDSRFRGIIVLTVIHDRRPAFDRSDPQILQRQFQPLDLAFDLSEDWPNTCFFSLAMRSRRVWINWSCARNVAEIFAFSACNEAISAFRSAGSSGRAWATFDMRPDTANPQETPWKQGVPSPFLSLRGRVAHPSPACASHNPFQSMASCAEVRRTAPSPRAGQGKRPVSRTL